MLVAMGGDVVHGVSQVYLEFFFFFRVLDLELLRPTAGLLDSLFHRELLANLETRLRDLVQRFAERYGI